MVRLIKIVPGSPRDLVVNSKLSPLIVTFVKKSSFALFLQNLISIFSPLFVTPVFFLT